MVMRLKIFSHEEEEEEEELDRVFNGSVGLLFNFGLILVKGCFKMVKTELMYIKPTKPRHVG